MFRFPFGTTQELNLDWFLEQWEIFKQEAQTAFDGIDHALDAEIERVEAAMTDLYAARDAAIAAKNNALDYAQSANTSAIGASQSAQNSAESAVTSAQQAQSAAQSANAADGSATAASTSATQAGNSAKAAQNSEQSAGSSAGNALAQAQNSEAWAIGSIGGVPVPPTADQYENNAKYYAESISGDAAAAAQSAMDAAASATAAATSAESVSQSAAQIAENTADIEDLKNAFNAVDKAGIITLTKGYYIRTSDDTVDINSPVRTTDTTFGYAVIPCSAGDTFVLNGIGGNAPRLYAFIKSDGTKISGAAASVTGVNLRTIAPAESAYIVINSQSNGISYKGDLPYNPVAYDVDTLTSSMFEKGVFADFEYRSENRIKSKKIFRAMRDISISHLATATDAVGFVKLYDESGKQTEFKSWSQGIGLKKGTLFGLTLTTSNSGTPVTTSIEDIFSCFQIDSWDKTAYPVNTGVQIDFSNHNVVIGLLSYQSGYSAEIVFAYNTFALSVLDYFKTDNALIRVNTDDSYRFKALYYDANFNYVDSSGILSGNNFLDVSAYSYVRFVLYNPTNTGTISVSDVSKLHVSKNFPVSIEYANSGNIISIAKDGINEENYSWAPKYPKSSIISFQKAFEQGFRSIMMHVQCTSDHVPVLFHDESITARGFVKNADGSAISETVRIANSTLEQLNQYDFGIAFGTQYKGLKIATLEDGLMWAVKHGVQVYIEPTVTLSVENETIVIDLVKKYGLQDNFAYQAYYIDPLKRVHASCPNAILLWAPSADYRTQHWAEYIALKNGNNLQLYFTATDANIETANAIRNDGVILIRQILNESEPDDIISWINKWPFYKAIETQIVPAYSALQMNT